MVIISCGNQMGGRDAILAREDVGNNPITNLKVPWIESVFEFCCNFTHYYIDGCL